jgi:hypothetical protein
MVLEVIALIVTTLVLELIAVISFERKNENYEFLMVFDFIKCYSSMLIFLVFLTAKSMKDHINFSCMKVISSKS